MHGGTELSVKTSRTAPNCTRTARPISTNFQSTLQCFHQKYTKCTKYTRGRGLSVKASRTSPNCTTTAQANLDSYSQTYSVFTINARNAPNARDICLCYSQILQMHQVHDNCTSYMTAVTVNLAVFLLKMH